MIGIVYATRREAEPFLKMADARVLTKRPFRIFEFSLPVPDRGTGVVIICGMGKVGAALGTQELIREYPLRHIINAGICGILADRPDRGIGSIFRVDSVSEGEPGPGIPEGPWSCSSGLFLKLPVATLVSSERPVFDVEERRALARWGQMVDMEGAIVARVAGMYGIPCTLLKGVTDFAGEGDREGLHRNLAVVVETMAGLLWDEIARLEISDE